MRLGHFTVPERELCAIFARPEHAIQPSSETLFQSGFRYVVQVWTTS